MAREIGWSQESNLLYQIKQLLSRASGGGSSTPLIETYATYSAFPAVGTAGVFYVDASSGVQYVWDGSEYVSVVNRETVNYPYPTATNTSGEPVLPFLSFSNVFYQTLNGVFYVYQLVNKSYPNPNEYPIRAYTSGAQNFNPVGNASRLNINNIEAFVQPSPVTFTLNSNINQIAFPNLKYIFGSITVTSGTPSASIFPFVVMPELIFAQSLTLNLSNSHKEINFPKAEVIQSLSSTSSGLERLLLPEVLHLGYTDGTNNALSQIILPKCKFLQLSINSTKQFLTTISLPAIEYCAQITFSPSSNFTTFNFGSTLKTYGTQDSSFITTSNNLNQASVDNILIRLAALNGTGGTTLLSGRTITITGTSATPSAAGLTAKATLQARGCTVTTN